MIDEPQDYEYDTRISPQDLERYGLVEGENIRLIGGVWGLYNTSYCLQTSEPTTQIITVIVISQ